MGSVLFGIGVSALQAAQINLATTSHNIANENTDGYSRQRAIQASSLGVATGAGYVGQGTHVTTIERMYSGLLSTQANDAQAKVSSLETYSSQASMINNLLMDSNAGLSSALTSFFAGIQQVTSDPSSLTTRQTMVSAATALTSRFQALSTRISEQYTSINTQIQNTVNSINADAKQIAELNYQITVAESSDSQQPNDLYDQRDQLVAELNKLIGAKTVVNTDGSYNVYFGNGQQLVTGTTATELAAVISAEDSSRMTVGIRNAAGVQELPESIVSGGSLSGLLEYRSDFLDDAANRLGQIAASLTLAFNAQHALGQDLSGNIGGNIPDFFTVADPQVIGNANNSSATATVSATFDKANFTNLTGSDYRLQYNGSNLTLTRLSDNASWSGADITALNTAIGSQGFSLTATGAFVAGSSYLIQPTRLASQSIGVNAQITSDVRKIAVAAPIATATGTANTGKATITAGSVAAGYTAAVASLPLTLTYNSATNELSGLPSGPVTYTSGTTISFSGISFSINGTPVNGDTFTISRNTSGTKDNRNALLLNGLQTAKTMAGNKSSFATVYSQLVSDAGNKGSQAQTVMKAQSSLLIQAQESKDSLSGVNLDEEAANLLKYQQAYQAAAKMLSIASTLFDSILAIGR